MKNLREQILYEEEALKSMHDGNANIPDGWSAEKQEAFVSGMKYALNLATADELGDEVCEKCGEIHDVEKAGGHDLIQANKVLLCECKEHPDDEFCKEILKNDEVDIKDIPY